MNERMNKMSKEVKRADLIQQLIDKHNYTKKAATAVVDDFTGIILDNLAQGNMVTIRKFGTFDVLERKPRLVPVKGTSEMTTVPTCWIPRFYPAKQMRLLVRMWEDSQRRGITE